MKRRKVFVYTYDLEEKRWIGRSARSGWEDEVIALMLAVSVNNPTLAYILAPTEFKSP